jgi:hypothetical protein
MFGAHCMAGLLSYLLITLLYNQVHVLTHKATYTSCNLLTLTMCSPLEQCTRGLSFRLITLLVLYMLLKPYNKHSRCQGVHNSAKYKRKV